MSDSPLPRTASPPLSASPSLSSASAPHGNALLRSLTGPLTRWLPRQRWFAGKGRPLGGLSLVAATEILPCHHDGPTPGLLHLLVRALPEESPATCGQTSARTVGDCYQLLLGVRTVLPATLTSALVGRPPQGPLRGRAVYEALHDPWLASLLLERLRAPGRLGALRFDRHPRAHIPSGLAARALTGEQTNSSVVYGEAHILKLFRRVSPGINPDLELPLALAEAGCSRVPAPSAWFEASWSGGTEEPITLGVLQPYLAGSLDGWQLALRSLSRRTDFSGAARRLGRATAEVHTALAATLPTATLRRPQLEQTAGAMAERLTAAVEAVPALRPYRRGLRRPFESLSAYARRGGSCTVQRLHGDLHLGQVLHTAEEAATAGRWTVIDFEGEPARPLAERRGSGPPVRDIAGILRSFDYAACQYRAADPWVDSWSDASRTAYCQGYAEASGNDPLEQLDLLRAYETDKAVYEVLYEARHRPDWLHVPMSAIRRLAGSG